MKNMLQSFVLLWTALMVPMTVTAAYVQLADGVYQDGSTLYIGSDVTSLGSLRVNPSVIYCYATIPPSLMNNTFTGYNAEVHVPAAGMVAYFTALYWYNFNNITADAIEPQSLRLSETSVELEQGGSFSLSETVTPSDATPNVVSWSSSNPAVATVSGGNIIAVAAGECDIIANCATMQAVCHVTVTPQRVTITLDKHETRLLPNHTMTLNAFCDPPTTDLAVTTSDPTVAIPRYVNGSIMVVGVGEGTATITVTTADGWAIPDACEVTVYTLLGDVNADGFVNVADVTMLISHILGTEPAGFNEAKADVNHDGNLNVADVTTLIAYILGNIDLNPPAETFTVNGVSFTMVHVEGGTFMMGASADDTEAEDIEKPSHKVSVWSYCIGQTEVTQELWLAVMGSNPSNFKGNLQCPVENVWWTQCQTFIAKLNELTGKTFRLPTEAEWEFAARGGNKSHGYKYSGSNDVDEVAWYYDNSSNTTHQVATKKANELGLYDMSGNVWEFCQDLYADYEYGPQVNPQGPASSTNDGRVGRCSGWNSNASFCRVTARSGIWPYVGWTSAGLRLALDVDNSSEFRLSKPVVSLLKNKTVTVDILNGSGNYSLTGGTNNVTTMVNGNSLIVAGNTVGRTTVFLTDNSTNALACLKVIVIEPETEYTVNGVSFKMIGVEGGTFMMGAPDDDTAAQSDEKPAHLVTLSSYSIGQTEVTQELWLAVMGNNPSNFKGNLQRPVEKVSWNDCQEFIAKLNELTGKTFRLPTEAEWEFAARGGNKSHGYIYSGSNDVDEVAWYSGNIPSQTSGTEGYGTQPVATKLPNELGLYDMSGNVREWCHDWHWNYSSDPQTDPIGSPTGNYRMYRAPGWCSQAISCRVTYRSHQVPSNKFFDLGLRLAM